MNRLLFNTDYFRKKSKKEFKWLQLLYCNYLVSDSFLLQLNKSVKFQFEIFISIKINWQRMYYFFEPVEEGQIEEIEIENIYYYKQRISLNDKITGSQFCGSLIWYEPFKFSQIKIENEDVPFINFCLLMDQSSVIDQDLKQFISAHRSIKMKPIFKDLSFPTFTYLESMPHEGKFMVDLFDFSNCEDVSLVFNRARNNWNTQTDLARETRDQVLEQGYCHSITFEGLENNLACWYVDAGSASESIHEYLLKALSNSGIKIKQVQIIEL